MSGQGYASSSAEWRRSDAFSSPAGHKLPQLAAACSAAGFFRPGAGADSSDLLISARSQGRLPQLGRPLQGCWSSPSLLPGRSILSSSGFDEAASSARGGSAAAPPSARMTTQQQIQQTIQLKQQQRIAEAGKKKKSGERIKNPAVWQRWQVCVPGNKLIRDEVLLRDRQRQRAACGWDDSRNIASPARSHFSRLFFSQVPGGDEATDCLPDPLRKIARPETRQCVPLSSSQQASQGESQVGSPTNSLASAMTNRLTLADAAQQQQPIIKLPNKDDLRDADLAFQPAELELLVEALDLLAELVKAPKREADMLSSVSPEACQSGMGGSGRVDMETINKAREAEKLGPLILRPMFCRFILAGNVAGPNALFRLNDMMMAFDEFSSPYGSFQGMPRAMLCGLFAKLLIPEEPEDVKKPQSDGMPVRRPPALQRFTSECLPAIIEHCRTRVERQHILKSLTAETPELVIPASILETCSAENIWPPLPPRDVTAEKLQDYMGGVKKWDEEQRRMHMSKVRLKALRAHTETVVHGEVLAAQLLEPEVLHFSTRFRPLFLQLFTAYMDWPSPEPRNVLDGTSPRAQSMTHKFLGLKSEQLRDQQGVGIGHMSFVSFFRFCIDFGLFQKHLSFEEIQRIYKGAETVRYSGEDFNQAPDEEEEKQEERKDDSPVFRSRASVSSCNTGVSRATRKPKSKKVLALVGKALTAALCELEASMPQVQLKVFDKAMAAMSPFEVKLITFFAAIEHWLSERTLRLSQLAAKTDIPPEDAAATHEKVSQAANTAALLGAGIGPDGKFLENPDEPKQFRNKDEEQAALRSAMRLVKQATELAIEQVSPAIAISAAGFSRLIAPLKMYERPSLEEVEEMFKYIVTEQSVGDDQPSGEGARRHEGNQLLVIPVFQLDKVLCKARDVMDKARKWSCSLMRHDDDLVSGEETIGERKCRAFLEALDEKLQERGVFGDGGAFDNVFADCNELNAENFLAVAKDVGVSLDLLPTTEELTTLLDEVVGRREGSYGGRIAYRCLALVREGRATSQHKERIHLMQRLSGAEDFERLALGPTTEVFGLSAFVECLIKMGLYRLGFKSVSDVQRSSPAWWKCTWLLTLLHGEFKARIKEAQHEQRIYQLAKEGEGGWDEAFGDQIGIGPPKRPPLAAFVEKDRTQRERWGGGSSASDNESVMTTTTYRSRGGVSSKAKRSRYAGSKAPSDGGSDGRSHTKRSNLSYTSAGIKAIQKQPPQIDKGPNQDAEVWWSKVQCGMETGCAFCSLSPIRWLVEQKEDMFAGAQSEVNMTVTRKQGGLARDQSGSMSLRTIAASAASREAIAATPCSKCGEKKTESGWGNPACFDCNSVEAYCLPLDKHVLALLMRTHVPPVPCDDSESD
eukprot:TRINITY_DN546_c0_g1_i3.p1 TRINITY_DN546_c0_g1~~TRINITY_DN546_c0_g1_i3.p1  ORF type:complete len:1376 (-),score=300.62 TRINITY_DN546_c0_g1_i3:331-4458(-)